MRAPRIDCRFCPPADPQGLSVTGRHDAFFAKFDAQAIGGKLSKEKCVAVAAESILEVSKLLLCPILFF